MQAVHQHLDPQRFGRVGHSRLRLPLHSRCTYAIAGICLDGSQPLSCSSAAFAPIDGLAVPAPEHHRISAGPCAQSRCYCGTSRPTGCWGRPSQPGHSAAAAAAAAVRRVLTGPPAMAARTTSAASSLRTCDQWQSCAPPAQAAASAAADQASTKGARDFVFAASVCSRVHTAQPELPSLFEAHSAAFDVQLGRGILVIFWRCAIQSSGSTACLLKFPTSVAGLGGGKARLQPSASLLRRLRQGKNRTVIISGDPSRFVVWRDPSGEC